jgi:hypothetical protein
VSQYRYYGKAAHMSADLKAIIKRVRASKPHYFVPKKTRTSSMDKDGKVVVVEHNEPMAIAMTPAYRHRMSLQRERY